MRGEFDREAEFGVRIQNSGVQERPRAKGRVKIREENAVRRSAVFSESQKLQSSAVTKDLAKEAPHSEILAPDF